MDLWRVWNGQSAKQKTSIREFDSLAFMDLLQYQENRLRQAETKRFRTLCGTCLQPERTCYCAHIQAFDPGLRFVILIHPIERRRRIATGRMSHLCLKNSKLIAGHDYTYNTSVNRLLADTYSHSVILYPGPQSENLSHHTPAQIDGLFPPGKTLNIFVIDGTWNTARKMLRYSENLKSLPRICFTPTRPSNFRVRKQPKPECYSTLEAIHHTLELLGPSRGFDIASGRHHNLLYVFDKMVEQQLEFIRTSPCTRTHSRHRR